MRPAEIEELCAFLTGAGMRWTEQRWTDASPAIWEDKLRPLDHDTAWETAGLIVDNNAEFPTIAEFRACYGQVARRRAEAVRALPEASEVLLPLPERVSAAERGIAAAKAILSQAVPWFVNADGEMHQVTGKAAEGLAAESLVDRLTVPDAAEEDSA